MFIGHYEHSLDSKGRLTLPASYAAQLAAGVVVTPGLEGCLYLFSQAGFEKLHERIARLEFTDTKARKLKRSLFPFAHAAVPDRQRRVLIPQWLREFAGISDKVLIAGVDDHVELWEPNDWKQHQKALKEELGDENFFAGMGV